MQFEKRQRHEIEHGRFLSSRNAPEIWNWEGAAGRLRWQRRVRMLAEGIGPGMRVLEIGCGTGALSRSLAGCGATILAVDLSLDLLRRARAEARTFPIDYVAANACRLPFGAGRFDRLIGSSVLHHLPLPEALAECRRLVKPGGRIVFTEPNMANPQILLQKNISFLKRWLGDSPDETAFFRWSLKRILEKNGFCAIQIVPFDFLHPALPRFLVPPVQWIGAACERIPLLSELAGSLHIQAVRIRE